MKYLINEVVDRFGRSYKLYLSLNESDLKDHVDIRIYSTFSGSSNPEKEQTKWKTTLPKDSFLKMANSFLDFYK